ncbi:MAG: ABC transporter ATP-binding protein [Deltaproteobacteria bacterium]|nr:ABC transporter ATP-binding protein [Deltaproteobacteria bacterium]
MVLQDVYKVYSVEAQPVEALQGINLSVKNGQIIAVIGKSGAGKSTLLHIVGTIDRPSQGRVWLNGTDVSTLNDYTTSVFRNSTIGFVFQMKNLFNEFTALENVMMPGLIAGIPRSAVKERAAQVLHSVGLSHRERHRPAELSGGEQQRVTIARALLMAPPVLLADEPTGNLDRKTSLSIQDLLLELCESYTTTMLLVTHDLDLAQRLPHQIIMEDGMIIDRGNL